MLLCKLPIEVRPYPFLAPEHPVLPQIPNTVSEKTQYCQIPNTVPEKTQYFQST